MFQLQFSIPCICWGKDYTGFGSLCRWQTGFAGLMSAGRCREDERMRSGWKLSGCWMWLYMRRELQFHSVWILQMIKDLVLPNPSQDNLEGTYCTTTDSSRYSRIMQGCSEGRCWPGSIGYGSLGFQASGDVGIAETFLDLKPTSVHTEHNIILWALVSSLRTPLLLNIQKQATWPHINHCTSLCW